MFIAQYKHVLKHTKLAIYKNPILYPTFQTRFRNCQIQNYTYSNTLVLRKYFASKKPNKDEPKSIHVTSEKNIQLEESQFLWKLNLFLNTVGIGASFYFPSQSLIFVLILNGFFQGYEVSRSINKFKDLAQKGSSLTVQQMSDSIVEIKQILKKNAINTGIILISSISIALGILYPSIGDYSLIGLNFWIMLNLKYNNLPHGYYLVLASLLVYQYFHFKKSLEQKEKSQSAQRL